MPIRAGALSSLLVALGIATSLPTPARAASSGKVVEVGSARGVAGRIVRGSLKVAEDSDGTPVALPVAVVMGRRPGPVVWVDAASHGDEYGGVRALQEVVGSLDPEAMSGTLVAVMIANPPAFQALQRLNPSLDDLTDMHDVFPGRERFTTERIAAALAAGVKAQADYFVDLHTGGDRFRQFPFVLYSIVGGVTEERYDTLARGFGVPTLWRDTARTFPNDAITYFSSNGIPAFLLEVGGGQPLDAADVRLQADAVRSFLRAVGVLAGAPTAVPQYTIVSGYRIVTNSRGGFFEAAVTPGERIREGTVLGRMVDVHGETSETIAAPAGAEIVLGVCTYPAAATGGWLLELGAGLSAAPGR